MSYTYQIIERNKGDPWTIETVAEIARQAATISNGHEYLAARRHWFPEGLDCSNSQIPERLFPSYDCHAMINETEDALIKVMRSYLIEEFVTEQVLLDHPYLTSQLIHGSLKGAEVDLDLKPTILSYIERPNGDILADHREEMDLIYKNLSRKVRIRNELESLQT